MDLSVVPYQQQHKSETDHDQHVDIVLQTKPITTMINSNPKTTKDPFNNIVKYKECMRNHAASIGGHANDGCGEFMPRGDDGTRDWLTCAACGCHRNFHRRESSTKRQHQQQLLFSPPPQPHQFLLYGSPTTKNMNPVHHFISRPHDDDDDDDDLDDLDHDRRSETPERGEVNVVGSGGKGFMVKTTGSSNKRFRTKFTQEQKERMLDFAEKIGWRIQKHDDMALNQFCNEVGVKRNVLKVWMHNNKNAHRRRDGAPPVSAEAPPPPPPSSAPTQPVGVQSLPLSLNSVFFVTPPATMPREVTITEEKERERRRLHNKEANLVLAPKTIISPEIASTSIFIGRHQRFTLEKAAHLSTSSHLRQTPPHRFQPLCRFLPVTVDELDLLKISSYTAPTSIFNQMPMLSRGEEYRRRRLNSVISPERHDPFDGYGEKTLDPPVRTDGSSEEVDGHACTSGDSTLSSSGGEYGTEAPAELPCMKPEDYQDFGALLNEDELSLEKQEERKIMKLLLKVKNGTPSQRKTALRQLSDKAMEFGAGPLFDQILPLLMRLSLEDQDRHRLVKVVDRIVYKLDELVRPYVHKILVVIEPLLIDEDYHARVEGREIISNLSKAAGLTTVITEILPASDRVDEHVRNTTARAFSVVASTLGILALLPFSKAVCQSKKS
ncbi:unnamed protein product [Dovyalis caffra]|uniref:ZF-HD dimerization-type domain-containing protein n=1 Tax=Dovyalis caffra TaxID=77055 RepID=A0AAV1S4J8_9ROSI|nr:unnamed protein product [Dovyalis caffra]